MSTDGDRWHEYEPGDEGNTFIWPDGEVVCAFLKWDEWPAGISDLIYTWLSPARMSSLAGRSTSDRGASLHSRSSVCTRTPGENITAYWGIVGYNVRTSPRLDMFTFSPPLQYQVAAGSIGEPATSPAALAVGALCWQSRQPEFYSSQGPTIDGRIKPDIAGHDGISGATYGPSTGCLSGFSGTSAAAPEVAGAAALVRQAFPTYGPDQLQQYLQKNARDMGAAGMDNVTGAGELQLPKPPDVVPPTVPRACEQRSRRQEVRAPLGDCGQRGGGHPRGAGSKRQGRQDDQAAGLRVATSPKTVATDGRPPPSPRETFRALRRCYRRGGKPEPRELRERIVLK